MPALVHIRGGGVAANCCAHLLQRAGLQVSMDHQHRPQIPAIMLSAPAISLIRDIFDRPDLFADAHRIDRRIVAWGGSAPATLPHDAVVVSERQLLEALSVECKQGAAGPADFVINASRDMPVEGRRHRFGSRRATAVKAKIKEPADLSACMIESLEEGWLFLIPRTAEEAWLIGVGGAVSDLIAHSILIAARVELIGSAAGDFETAPSIVTPLYGEGWLACGTAAISFDPICGDGTAQAVREAILVGAVMNGLAHGDRAAVLAHYEAVLTAAMRRHLVLCADFYRTGGNGVWWERQGEALLEGHSHCTHVLAQSGDPRYELRGFELVPRQLAG
jgi:hypothetical protein